MKHDKNTKNANRNIMNDNKNAVQIIEHIMKNLWKFTKLVENQRIVH